MKRSYTKQMIERYFHQLSIGCGNANCSNINCASNIHFVHLTPNQAAAQAIQLLSEGSPFCADINLLTTSNFSPSNSGVNLTSCDNSSNMNKSTSSTKARAKHAIESQSYIDEQLLNQLIDHCKKNNTFVPLIRSLGKYFSSREYLVKSFQKKQNKPRTVEGYQPKSEIISSLKTLNKEDFRALNEDEKEKDESRTYNNLLITLSPLTLISKILY